MYHPTTQIKLTQEEKSLLPRKRRQEAFGSEVRKGLHGDASDLIDLMGPIIRYPRAHYFKLACALWFVSGRGLPELLGTAVQHLPSSHGTHESEIIIGDVEGHQGSTCRIPLLCEYEHFIGDVSRLRGMKDTSRLTPAEVKKTQKIQ